MDPEDEHRLERLTRRLATWEVFAGEPGVTRSVVAALSRHCRVDHAAIMLFPRTIDDLRVALRARGYEVRTTGPCPVVRRRLADRYGLDLPVLGVHAVGVWPPALQVFAVEDRPGVSPVVAGERERNEETYLAIELLEPDEVVIRGIVRLLVSVLGFAPDGGGFDPGFDPDGGFEPGFPPDDGRTVLYLSRPAAWPRRVELAFAGHYPHILRAHLTSAPELVGDR